MENIVYDWQSQLRTGLIDTDVMVVDQRTVNLVQRVLGHEVTQHEIEDVLLARAEYLDEEKWCENLAEVLELPHITLRMIDNRFVPLRITIDGVTEPLTDPRVLQAAMQAMRFRRATAIGIEAGGCIAVLRPGHPTVARIDTSHSAAPVRSEIVITAARLASVERQGGALTDLLGLPAAAAA